ncbi:MAG: LamG domain-containing protein [Gammaproteobacteria bacterium]|nr:LamG domain-containing protein [Gammaproteobacteria bacterium]
MRATTIHGYADRLSVAPGETIELKVSCEAPGRYRADVVRLVNGDTNPDGPGFREELVETTVNGEYEGRYQATDVGSCVLVPDPDARLLTAGAFTLHAFIQPTTPGKPMQGVLGRYARDCGRGYALVLDEGRPGLLLGGPAGAAAVFAPAALQASLWYSVAASYDPAARRVRMHVRPVVNSVNSLLSPAVVDARATVHEEPADVSVADSGTPFVMAGLAAGASATRTDDHFNGKIDRPALWARVLSAAEIEGLATGRAVTDGLLAAWDFAAGIGPQGIAGDEVLDAGPQGLHGRCVNMPVRAVTGWNWRGHEEDFRHAPHEYGAIHFHDDDLDDCCWDTDITFTVPADLASDVYALRLRLGDAEDHIPFFVLPPRGRATAKTLFLVPTASYLAYANDHIVHDVPVAQAILGHTSVIAEQDLYFYGHTELGLSTYDLHADGSGTCYSSARRPIINMRPKFRHAAGTLWQFPADLHLVDWLNASGFDYDVATDLELHQEGAALLERYQVVLTGTHPEYYSGAMLDAFEHYLGNGGRAMYLGANGFYWVTAWHPDKPWLIEVRKGESGSRAWQAKPGEYHLASTGERSGLWRNRGRAPQKLFGVGFTAEGFDRSAPYRQLPDARDPRAAFITAGIGADELIGDFGLIGGGAAGYELDRYDLALGTPPQALLLAASEGHSDNYPHVCEEIFFNFPGMGGTQDFQVRADLVYFTTGKGGGVFSTGSIAWCGSLAHAGYDNNVSRMMRNVLTRFLDPAPLPPLG